jgi:hypothetical protein
LRAELKSPILARAKDVLLCLPSATGGLVGVVAVLGGVPFVLASVFDLHSGSVGKYVYINQGGTSNLTLSVANLVVVVVIVVLVVAAIAAAIPRRMVS